VLLVKLGTGLALLPLATHFGVNKRDVGRGVHSILADFMKSFV